MFNINPLKSDLEKLNILNIGFFLSPLVLEELIRYNISAGILYFKLSNAIGTQVAISREIATYKTDLTLDITGMLSF